MKKIIAVLIIPIIIIALISVNSYVSIKLAKDVEQLSEDIYFYLEYEDWNSIRKNTDFISQKWNTQRLWFAFTLNHEKINQIDTAIEQSKRFAYFEEKADYIDKVTALSTLIKQIPPQEGLSIENLL